MESERGATTAAAAPSPRKAQPKRSQLAHRHVLRGAAFTISLTFSPPPHPVGISAAFLPLPPKLAPIRAQLSHRRGRATGYGERAWSDDGRRRPVARKAQPERSQLARRHVLRGAAFAIVTALLLSVLGRPGNRDDAASRERPPSSTADVYEQGELTPLQRHVAFFDRDKDGVIYASETYQGFRAIGCGVPLSAAAAVFINGGLGPKTIPENEKTPPFKLPIYVTNIHKGKHGSDSGVYDANGRFVPEKFEIFKKHARTRPDALTGKELQELLKANREPNDFKGWLGGFTEWKVLYYVCKDKDGFLHKDTARAVYDGSLFERLEDERKSNKDSTS
ncbi:probable peroxygenase 4 [Panicum virgatum]|uniref:probable peroxygenase 4 n=1 Tax=Panicum virgatum TaxID=38727 RepID=UPI0019D626E9|nr:probable peroxygenase 4 [Panicum virgatum]